MQRQLPPPAQWPAPVRPTGLLSLSPATALFARIAPLRDTAGASIANGRCSNARKNQTGTCKMNLRFANKTSCGAESRAS